MGGSTREVTRTGGDGWTIGGRLVLVAACLWFLAAHLLVGPLFSPDSQSSVVLADELLTHGSYAMPFVEASPRSLANGGQANPPPWPPGMPALTALLAKLLPLTTWRAAQVLAVLAALACVLLTALLIRKLGGSAWTAALGAFAFAVSGATTAVAPYVWSELLFVVPVLAALIVFVADASSEAVSDCRAGASSSWEGLPAPMDGPSPGGSRGWKPLPRGLDAATGARRMLAVGLLALAACLVRYAGVGLVLTLGVCLVLRRGPVGVKLRSLALATGIPAAGVAAWLLRNKLLTGYLDDYRPSGDNGLLVTLAQPFKTVLMMLAGLHPHKAPLALLLLTALTLLLVVLIRQWPRVRPLGRGLTCVFAYAAIYTLWLCVARWRTNLSPIDYRYLWPMWPALLAGCAVLAQRLVRATANRRVPLSALAVVMAVIVVGGLLTLRQYAAADGPQTRQECAAREAMALSPEVAGLVRGKQVLVVDYWPDPLRQLTYQASRVWYTSPYAYSVRDFRAPGEWRDWLLTIDVVLSPTIPLALDDKEWSARQVPGGATAYLRR